MVQKRILGIDPGLTRCGVGIVDSDHPTRTLPIYCTAITTKPSDNLAARLYHVFTALEEIITKYNPSVIGCEQVFSHHNKSTSHNVAAVIGFMHVFAVKYNIPIYLITPSEVKLNTVGYGNATKNQIQLMVKKLLKISEDIKPADAADAYAIAITCARKYAHNTAKSRIINK